jgi:hypothetical protein
MTGRSLRLARRNIEAILTSLLHPVMLMLLFVYLFGGAIETGTRYVTYVVPGGAAAVRRVRGRDDGRQCQHRHDRRDHRPVPVPGRRRRLGPGRPRHRQHGPQPRLHRAGVRGGLRDRVPAWCLAILVASVAVSGVLFRRRTA